MVILGLVLLGLCLGSFANAFVWRVHQQAALKGKESAGKDQAKRLSVLQGRSMCPNCRHELGFWDLIPVVSWLGLRGKCRYCRKPISPQYPLVEAATAAIFTASYLWWPHTLQGLEIAAFIAWLAALPPLIALLVYDIKWYLLPNRIIWSAVPQALIFAVLEIAQADDPARAVLGLAGAVLIGGGLFYALFQISAGKWIGGGDVKLGALLALLLITPGKTMLMIFLASLIGTLISVPLLAAHKLKAKSTIPFGPLLIVAAIISQLFGQAIIDWYLNIFIPQ